jgi:hypothetical protein
MVELLKQPAASPYPVGREIVSIWAGTTGKMDDIPVGDIRRFESELLDYIEHNSPELFDTLANAKALEDSMVADLENVVEKFKKQFQPSDTSSPGPSATSSDAGQDTKAKDDSKESSGDDAGDSSDQRDSDKK